MIPRGPRSPRSPYGKIHKLQNDALFMSYEYEILFLLAVVSTITPNCDWWDVHCFVLCVQVLSVCITHSSLLIKMLDSNYMCN